MALESNVWQDLKNANLRVKLLKHCLTIGEPVYVHLQQAETELADLRRRLPYGDVLGFCVFIVWTAISAWAVWFFATNATLPGLWGSPVHPYLEQYRSSSAWIWQGCQILSSSIAAAITTVAIITVVWIVQRRMVRPVARTLLCTLIAVEIAFNVTLLFAFFRLLMMSLLR